MKYLEYLRILKESITIYKITEDDKQEFKTIIKVMLLLIIGVITLVLPIYAIDYILTLLGFINLTLELALSFAYFILWDVFILMYMVFRLVDED